MTTLILALSAAAYALAVGSFATAAIRTVQRRAEREQARHEQAEKEWREERAYLIETGRDERRELLQTASFLGRRSGPPQAWAREPLPEEAQLAARIAPAEDVVFSPSEIPVPYEDVEIPAFQPESNGNGSVL